MQENQTDTGPVEISPVQFTGKIQFSCCRTIQEISGESRSEVTCSKCRTVYGLVLLIRLLAVESSKFPIGTFLRPKRQLEVIAGSSPVSLLPSQAYQAYQDTFGVLNIPPNYQPILVNVTGSKGKRPLIALVHEDELELVEV